jgi:hypothetical protein
MSFWDLSDSSSAAKTGTEYEVPGGNLDPIPDGSSVLAVVDQAKWQTKDANDPSSPAYIELRWSILAPDQYKNRKIFHKLWVTDFDPSAKDVKKATEKRDKARRMLAAVDANAGGKLTQNTGIPNDDALAFALLNKPMTITLMTWEISDSRGTASGNWLSAVAPKAKGVDVKPPKAKAASRPRDDFGAGGGYGDGGAANYGARTGAGAIDDDEIPF